MWDLNSGRVWYSNGLKLSSCRMVNYPPASETSREVANLTKRKNLHTPVYGVKEFIQMVGLILFLLLSYLFFIESTLCLKDFPVFFLFAC